MEHWGFLVEAGLFGAAALGWGFWQLWSLRREARQDQGEAASKGASPRHPEG